MMDNLIGNGDEDVQILQKYITKAEEQFDRIEQKHGELIDLVEDQSQFEEEEKWMTECEKGFIQVLVRAKRVVDQGIQFSGNNQQQLPSASSSPLHSRVSQVPTQPVSTGTSQFSSPFHTNSSTGSFIWSLYSIFEYCSQNGEDEISYLQW